MEDLFELLIVVAIALFGITSKSSKKKKKQTAEKEAQKAKPVTEPAPAAKLAKPIADLTKDLNRQNIESAVAAFAELLENKAELPNPDKPAAKAIHEPTAIEIELNKAAPVKARKPKKAPLKSGESKTDAHGCIGGSMPDHEAEGETIAEHAQHEQNRQKKLAEEAAFSAASLRKPSAADLRRAVVMSEVLDKPVSLRGRRI